MTMHQHYSSIWHSIPSNLDRKIEICIDEGSSHLSMKGVGHIFFRADDVAVPSRPFNRLLQLFSSYRVPLSLAVVPAWLTGLRWEYLKEAGHKAPELWCWHQHGWRHVNHEKKGKKQEFGPNRPHEQITKEILKGRHRLEILMAEFFYPVFTPPWNRCSFDTLNVIKERGFYAVSREKGSLPPSPDGLFDFQIHVDLHTRKSVNPIEDWNDLFAEISQAISSGNCGVMIHHQRMNDAAFGFLEGLLKTVVKRKHLVPVNFKDMVAIEAGC